ncbi:NAD(P)/FAD-dependent oxidoreductase [Nocardioides nitrophenolicus]|uniref:NAD(P)/FAD-dependent oxidoreductase n=1 Tax=Nocardioides nitrophenolicus TaxID=60489 RepID=UPI00195E6F52|nr:FAD-dependent oxidoreductase [Nocardioides nitrophenolicus]MBM7516504.1 NADPH-dependent 2,4-dienoyl-CoA reductase/sulfur reductase-like enzyme [Nocardioides nitrophenolicus]
MSATAPRIVVVGAGLAGLRVCERLRAAGHDGPITVFGDEEHPPYNRPPLSKELLRGTTTVDKLAFKQRPATEDVTWLLGTPVTAVDLTRREVTLADGSSAAYDGLVVATGVRARRLSLDGEPGTRHTIRTIEDAQRVARNLTAGTRVVVIGAGFIGCEVAATAVGLGCDVTVVEPLSAPLERAVGVEVGREVQRRHEVRGVRFALGRTVTAVIDAGEHLEIELDRGSRIPADVVIEAVGSQANTEPLAGQGLDLSNGVLCDAGLHPLRDGRAVLDVVVVGDVARFPVHGFGELPLRVEHWTMPTDMAAHAAASLLAGIAGGRADEAGFAPLPTFWSEQYGVRMQSFGVPSQGLDDVRVLEGTLGEEAAVGYHRDGRLVGVVLIGMARRMVDFRTAVSDARLTELAELAPIDATVAAG